MVLLNMIIFCDCYMLDRYLNTHDLFMPQTLHISYNATAFHTPPAEFLMQTITVCGPLYCKHEFPSHCDFISSTLIIMILYQLKAVNVLLKELLVAEKKNRGRKKKKKPTRYLKNKKCDKNQEKFKFLLLLKCILECIFIDAASSFFILFYFNFLFLFFK